MVLCDSWQSYPAHGQLQLQLCQPSANAHPLPDAKRNVGERIDGVVLPQPALRFEMFDVIKILLIRPQYVGVDQHHCL